MTKFNSETLLADLKTVATLFLLLLVFPVNLLFTSIALLSSAFTKPKRHIAASPKTLLISGGKMTKALQLARSFHAAGHRVVLVETRKYRFTGHRFSRAVARFYTVPEPPAPDYADALLDIVKKEKVDVYVPVCSPVASLYDAKAKQGLSEHCEVIHGDGDTVAMLDDKYAFTQAALAAGLQMPTAHRITEAQQVIDFDFSEHEHPFILKSIPYDSVRRLDLTRLPRDTPQATAEFVSDLPISETQPWIMQAFVAGQEYCTHSTVRDGKVQLHCCCESSAFQINYEHVDKPEIAAWVRQLAKDLNLTGQYSFDFIETEEGVYALECNPRTHSAITMFYNHPGVADAYLEPLDDADPLTPLASSRPTYWLYHEVWRLLTKPAQWRERLAIIFGGKDAIFSGRDPLPFLLVHHLQIPYLLLDNLRRRKGWVRIDFNIGKLVELGGD